METLGARTLSSLAAPPEAGVGSGSGAGGGVWADAGSRTHARPGSADGGDWPAVAAAGATALQSWLQDLLAEPSSPTPPPAAARCSAAATSGHGQGGGCGVTGIAGSLEVAAEGAGKKDA